MSGDPDDNDDYSDDYYKDSPDKSALEEGDEMDRKYPNYSRESRNAGRFLGLDHPYVPGDF